jgi:hypothetical protein
MQHDAEDHCFFSVWASPVHYILCSLPSSTATTDGDCSSRHGADAAGGHQVLRGTHRRRHELRRGPPVTAGDRRDGRPAGVSGHHEGLSAVEERLRTVVQAATDRASSPRLGWPHRLGALNHVASGLDVSGGRELPQPRWGWGFPHRSEVSDR